jgi:hypothetical protein
LVLRLDLTNQSAEDFRLEIAKWLGMVLNSAAQVALIFNPLAGEGLWIVATKDPVPRMLNSEDRIAFGSSRALI